MEYQWDQAKVAVNLKKHGVAFSEAALALEDPHALTMADPDAIDESRFICLGAAHTRKYDEKTLRLFES